MPKTIQIRDVDDEVYAGLRRHAAELGVSVPEYLRREAAYLAARPTTKEWLARTRQQPPSSIPTSEVLAIMDEWRGPWPDADR
jgi:hypothetical protein